MKREISENITILNNQKTAKRICDFLKEEFRKRKRLCAVLGISGGIDSALAAFLCKKAGLELYLVSMPYG
ncbi:MAG: hypothetical protein KAU95_04040, partial [Candidatus Aenigmarchaeota archaeon]|nr:hypothetical protein [Candidatus Aenigmarchaeota archaeon]